MTRTARRHVVAIYLGTVTSPPSWPTGPLPLTNGELRADTEHRTGYYPARTVSLLYGTADIPRRWHMPLDRRAGPARLVGVEVLRVDPAQPDGLVIVHLRPDDGACLDVLRALAGRTASPLEGYDPDAELDGHARVDRRHRPYTIAFVTPRGRSTLPRLYRHPRYLTWPATHQWLWALASRTNLADYPPDPHTIAAQVNRRLRLSADWSGLVLRDGMALVGTRRDQGARDPFYGYAELYVATLYLDAILLGVLQLHGIAQLEDALADAMDQAPAAAMIGLQQQVTAFRNRLWWQHLSTHGLPNQLLTAYQRQHKLPERFEQILSEIRDFNQLAREDQTSYINSAIVLFTIVTVPVGIFLAVLEVLGSPGPWATAAIAGAGTALIALLLRTRTGRLVIGSIRQRRPR